MNAHLLRVTKLGALEDAKVRSGNWETYIAGGGAANAESLPVDYEVVGHFIDPPIPGGPMTLLRLSRNGVQTPGVFTSSPVRHLLVVTDNSVYRIEPEEGWGQSVPVNAPGVRS